MACKERRRKRIKERKKKIFKEGRDINRAKKITKKVFQNIIYI